MVTRVIQSESDRRSLVRLIESRKIPFTVNIVDGKPRSVQQNRTQRMWLAEAAEQLGGHTAEELRGIMKLTIGVPILRSEDAVFKEKYDSLIKGQPYETKLAYMMEPFDFPVTRLMTSKQKTAYLDQMQRKLSEMGVILTQPEERR